MRLRTSSSTSTWDASSKPQASNATVQATLPRPSFAPRLMRLVASQPKIGATRPPRSIRTEAGPRRRTERNAVVRPTKAKTAICRMAGSGTNVIAA